MEWIKVIQDEDSIGIKRLIDDDKEEELLIIDDIHYSPLLLAAKLNKLSSVKLLVEYHVSIKHWAKINMVDSMGMSSLMYAIQNKNMEMVLYLIEEGADFKGLQMEMDDEMRELIEYEIKNGL